VLCFAVLLLAYVLVLRPQSKRLSRIEIQVVEKKNEENAAREAANEKTREKLNEQIKNLKEQLSNFIIKPGEIQNVASKIQKIAEDTQLTSIKINPSSGKPISVFDDCQYVSGHPITVNFAASFSKFATFINELERHKSVIFIDTFSINKSDEDSNHKVEMQLSVLVEKQEQIKESKG
jgi:Tfp pilus assembly protein PilO